VRRAPLVPAVLAVAGGIAWSLSRPVPSWGGPFLLPAALAGALMAARLAAPTRAGPTPGAGTRAGARAGAGAGPGAGGRLAGRGAAVVLALLLAAGALLGAATRAGFESSCVHRLPDDGTITVAGTIAGGAGTQLRLHVETVRLGHVELSCADEVPARWRGPAGSGAAAVGSAESGGLAAGTRIEASGRWWTPPGALPAPLRRPGALLLEDVAVVGGGPGRPAAGERFRRGARSRADSLFGTQAPLAASVLLAQRDALDREVRDRFARAGLSHLLAISGLHVGLICGILLLAGSLLRLGRRWSAVFAAAGTVAYVALLGAPHSAMRAALQLVLLLAATMLQRPTRPEALVAAAALVILVMEPGALLSPGFQLSFAGVAGLLALRPPFLRLLGGGRQGEAGRARRWLADALATSIAATLSTAPVVAWHFGQVAPIGVAANLVAIPLLSLALPALALALLAGTISPAAGAFLAGPGVLGLAALDRVAALAAAVPGGALAVHGSTALLLTGALAAGWVVSGRLGRVRPVIQGAVWASVAAAIVLGTAIRPASDRLEIHVIDVGQGDAIAVRSPAGRWLLVDAGVAGRGFDAGERRVVPYLARRGVRRLEGVVLTHPHLDHLGGAEAVIRSLRPRWVGDPAAVAPSAPYLAVLRLAEATGTPWVGLRQGHRLVLDGVAVEFLHPETIGADEADPNDLSVVMKVSYGEFSALLTGDATARVEARLLRGQGHDLRADVLKLGHHGSATSTTAGFLAATAPRLALVSAGGENRYGHPHRAVIDRLDAAGVAILRTDRHGSVAVRADSYGGIAVHTERGTAGHTERGPDQ
jgi:competence protein ComEC